MGRKDAFPPVGQIEAAGVLNGQIELQHPLFLHKISGCPLGDQGDPQPTRHQVFNRLLIVDPCHHMKLLFADPRAVQKTVRRLSAPAGFLPQDDGLLQQLRHRGLG